MKEAAASSDGGARAGDGVASERIGRETPLRVVDTILTGVHRPGENHFELLRAFVTDAVLNEISVTVSEHGYRPHEFGDFILIERRPRVAHDHSIPDSASPKINVANAKCTEHRSDRRNYVRFHESAGVPG